MKFVFVTLAIVVLDIVLTDATGLVRPSHLYLHTTATCGRLGRICKAHQYCRQKIKRTIDLSHCVSYRKIGARCGVYNLECAPELICREKDGADVGLTYCHAPDVHAYIVQQPSRTAQTYYMPAGSNLNRHNAPVEYYMEG